MSPTQKIISVVVLGALSGSACATASSTVNPRSPVHWQTRLDADNPLTGKIWDVSARAFIAEGDLHKRLASSRFVAGGETHDNPDHHLLQAGLLAAIRSSGRAPTVVFSSGML